MPVTLPSLQRKTRAEGSRRPTPAVDNYDSSVNSKFRARLYDIIPEKLPRAVYKILRCEFPSDDSDTNTDTSCTSDFGTFSVRSWVFGKQ